MNEFIELIKSLHDPYPKSINGTIQNDDDYIRLVPDSKERTAVSWWLMGEAFRTTIERLIELVEDSELSPWIEIKSAADLPTNADEYLFIEIDDTLVIGVSSDEHITISGDACGLHYECFKAYMPIPDKPKKEK